MKHCLKRTMSLCICLKQNKQLFVYEEVLEKNNYLIESIPNIDKLALYV